MTKPKDTRTNPLSGRDQQSPSQMTRLGNGMYCTAPTVEPESETDGEPVQDWSSVHVIFYADKAARTGLLAVVRAWRYYSKQRDGQSGAGLNEVGRWVFDCNTTVALDPDLANQGRSSHHVWQTRGCEKMYWQIVKIIDEDGVAPVTYPWVIAQPFGFSRNDDEFSVSTFDTGCGGVDPTDPPECCPGEFPFLAGVKATHWSPNDGTVIYNSGTKLTCSAFPFTVDDANCDILGIQVRNNGRVITEYVNGHNGISIFASANVITVQGAPSNPFAVTDLNYYVFINYQDKAEMYPVVWAERSTHRSPQNGTATYNSATKIVMAGFPFVVDNANCHVLGIVQRKASGAIVEYINGHGGVTITASANTLTIAGAGTTPFLVTDLNYYVYILYEEKAYTEATDSYRTEEIAPLNSKYTQPAYIVNDVAIVADPAGGINVPSDDGIVMDGYKDVHFQIHLLGGQKNDLTNRTITLKFQGSNDVFVGGVRQWVDLGVGYDLNADSTASTWTSTGLTAIDTEVDFDNWMGKRIRANYDFDGAPEADHPGACVITERRKAL